ncbi:MAG: YHS domain-containing (seleno)protein [Pseudomonadota bacterium]
MKQLSISLILAGFAEVLFFGSIAIAQAADDRLALKGYDTVAYFTDKRASLGSSKYQHEWDGAVYRFASAKHLALFKAEPDRYLPQYNNWCAASVSKGVKVHGNPEWWLVVDGRLYLFGKPIGPDLMRADPAMRSKAEKDWSKVSQLPTPPVPDYMRGAVVKQ